MNCAACENKIPRDEIAEIAGWLFLPGHINGEFALHFHAECIPAVFYAITQKVMEKGVS